MRRYRIAGIIALTAALMMLSAWPLHTAQAADPSAVAESAKCTNFADRAQQLNSNEPPKDGLLTEIYTEIKATVGQSTQQLFNAFTSNKNYQDALFWAASLMVTFYAVAFTMGVVQASFQQALMRLIKFSVVLTLASPGGWDFFSQYVVNFFQNGTDELIQDVQFIATGISPGDSTSPFYALDRTANFLFNPDTIIAILGAIGAGPYGLMMGGLMAICIFGFVKLILNALRVYAVAFVARAIMLGLAPLFFIFLMFERTKGLFTAWVNALVNFSLQPILLFTFLSFFIVLIESASRDVMGTEFCWTEFNSFQGGITQLAYWRPVDKSTGSPFRDQMTFAGSMSCILSDPSNLNRKCPEFPVNIIDLLTFLVLVFVAQRFADVVEKISADLSNSVALLDAGGRLEQILQQQNQSAGSFLRGNVPAGGRSGP